jgi:hypothetical protein
VVAGQDALIEIVGAPTAPMLVSYTVDGVVRKGYRYIAAGGNGARSIAVDIPQARNADLNVWLRISGGGCEVHALEQGATKVSWLNNGSPKDELRWVFVRNVRSDDKLSRITCIIPPNIEGSVAAATLSSDAAFDPTGVTGPSNHFLWRTNTSSVGKHQLSVMATSGAVTETRRISIEVVPPPVPELGAVSATYASLPAVANVPATPATGALRVFGDSESVPAEIKANGLAFPVNHGGASLVAVAAKSSGSPLVKADVPQGEDLVKITPEALADTVTIPVKLSGARLWFLHAARGSAARLGDMLFDYQIEYSDGFTVSVPVREGERVAGQLNDPNISIGTVAHSALVDGATVNLFLTSWDNPRSDKTITAIRVRAVRPRCIAIVAGIAASGREPVVPPAAASASDVSVTADFGLGLGPVKQGLFSMNTPYLFDQTAQSSATYFGILNGLHSPVVRIWNRIHPNADGKTRFDAAKDVPSRIRENFVAITKQTRSRLLVNLFGDMPEAGLTDETKFAYYATWYADVLKYYRDSLGGRIGFVELYNERNIGKPTEQRMVRYRFFNVIADRIHKEIPGVKVGGMAECWPDIAIEGEFIDKCGRHADFVSWHMYPTGSVETPIGQLMERTDRFATVSQQIANEVQARQPDRPLAQMVTEYNINYSAWKPYDPRLAQGQGAAWTLSMLLNCLYRGSIDIANYWHFGGGAYGVTANGVLRPTARLFNILNTEIGQGTLCQAGSSQADVECLAVRNAGGYFVAFVNKSTDARTVHVDLLNYSPAAQSDPFAQPVRTWFTGGQDAEMVEGRTGTPGRRDWIVKLAPVSTQIFAVPAILSH